MKQVILITGASSGMGKETALELIKQGHIVYGAARRIEKMLDLENAGGHAIKMDMTDSQSMKHAVDQVLNEQGKIDVLINNAGYAVYGAVEDITIEEARRQFDVNLFGLAELTKLALPGMRAQNSGKIINTSSMGGKMYTPLGAWYHATKHALEGWSDCLRLELKQFNIDVVIIEPGAIETEFLDVMYKPMMERSAQGPYSEMTNHLAAALEEANNGGGSPTSVIAEAFVEAVNSNKPKTRYARGKYAKPMIWMRTRLGDRFFDRVIMSQINSMKKRASKQKVQGASA